MRTFKIDFTFLILIWSTGITTSEVYKIFRRRPTTVDGWKSGTDSFKIPRSLCRPDESSSMNCAKLNARANGTKGDHCLCSCASGNATFIFNKNHWTCLRNSKVRDLLGHNLSYRFFDGENEDSQLRMLDINDMRRIPSLPVLEKDCGVIKGSSTYTGCDGVDVPFSSSPFAIQNINPQGPFYFFALKVNSGVSNTDLLRGKIIKIAVKCTLMNGRESRRWLMFKFVGNISCTSSELTTTRPSHTILTLLPSASTKTTTKNCQTSSLDSLPITSLIVPTVIATASSAFNNQSTVFNGLRKVSIFSASTSESRRTVIVRPSTTRGKDIQPTKDFLSTTPPKPSSTREERSGDESPLSVSITAGITASGVIIIILFGCLVCRRHHLSKSPHPRVTITTARDSVTSRSQLNPAYDPDDENFYRSLSFEEAPVYASPYKVHQRPSTDDTNHKKERQADEGDTKENHYVPLNIPMDQTIYGSGNTQEPLYNVLDNPVSDDEIIYQNYGSNMEKPVSNSVEPVYNSLEECHLEGPKEPNPDGCTSHERPIYGNTSERCYQKGAEASDYEPKCINEPIYSVIDENLFTSVLTDDDSFVTKDFVESVLKELGIKLNETSDPSMSDVPTPH